MLTLSKNLTFSLAIVTMLAFGFALAPGALAQAPKPVLSVTDVSKAAGYQVQGYAALTGQPTETSAVDTAQEIITLNTAGEQTGNITFYIRLHTGLATIARTSEGNPAGADTAQTAANEHLLHISDITIAYLDRNGLAVAETIDQATSVINDRNTAFPDGRNFVVTIADEDVPTSARYVHVSIAAGEFNHFDPNAAFRAVGAANVKSAINDPAKPGDLGALLKDGEVEVDTLKLQLVNADRGNPTIVSIVRVSDATSAGVGAATTGQFGGTPIAGNFNVKVTFSEEPNLGTKEVATGAGKVQVLDPGKFPVIVAEGKITAVVKGAPFYAKPSFLEGNYANAEGVPNTTGRDLAYHSYLLTVEPKLENRNDVVIRVKRFEDMVIPAKSYEPPSNFALVNNRSVLRVQVDPGAVKKSATTVFQETDAYKNLKPQGHEYQIPGGTVIPANGYLVIARGTVDESGIRSVTKDKFKDNDNRERADNQTDFNYMHNVIHEQGFPYPGDDLDAYFRNGATIKLGYQDAAGRPDSKNKKTGYIANNTTTVAEGAVIISEVMWGRDEGAATGAQVKSQWIELHNTTPNHISIDEKEWVITFGTASNYTAIDTVSNTTFPAAQPGNGGVTKASTTYPVTAPLVSMFRVPGGDGTTAAGWMASPGPGSNSPNFLGLRYGTPGGATAYTAPTTDTDTTDTEPTTPPVVEPDAATVSDLAISEIMYSVGRGNLPQWIELHNMSVNEVSLKGLNIEIENEGATDLTITLGATNVGPNEAVLLVSKNGRNSGMGADGDEGEGEIRASRVVNLKDLGVTGTLLSSAGFKITLSPKPTNGSSVRMDGDVAGGMDWDLPMMDGDRSSLIREKNADGTYKDGSMRMSWHPTSSTGRYGTYYGHPSDMGTPGYVQGGALPVELSMFYPARDRLTGAVEIKWETQSELNNAGFFVKRSTARKGPFTVINPTMIPGAGTTSEKQSYTYTDTSAKPNVLYFYQIEDVSLDGKRATLTNAHRLRGHIGAAGKATTIWGELKSQE